MYNEGLFAGTATQPNPLVAIAGPTGSGKSELALRIALEFKGEVVNCDSLQVYRHGRPIAVICPVSSGPHPRWLKRPERVRLNEGANLSDAVLEDRDERPR